MVKSNKCSKDVKIAKCMLVFITTKSVLNRSNKLIKKLNFKKRVMLAPKLMCGMKKCVFYNLISKLGSESIINSSAKVRCNDCKFMCKINTSSCDLRRTFKHFLNNKSSLISSHLVEFPNHSICESLYDIKRYRNGYDLKIMVNSTL